jgi:ketosteroid isomerase-like protein
MRVEFASGGVSCCASKAPGKERSKKIRRLGFVPFCLMCAPAQCAGPDSALCGAQSNRPARFAETGGDAKAVAAFYTEDAIAFPPGAEMVKGRAAIQQMWQETMDSGVKSLSFTVIDVGASGDLAHETGTALMNIQPAGKEPTTASIKYVVVWKKQGNDWKASLHGTTCRQSIPDD